jgi:hypothetical protein
MVDPTAKANGARNRLCNCRGLRHAHVSACSLNVGYAGLTNRRNEASTKLR